MKRKLLLLLPWTLLAGCITPIGAELKSGSDLENTRTAKLTDTQSAEPSVSKDSGLRNPHAESRSSLQYTIDLGNKAIYDKEGITVRAKSLTQDEGIAILDLKFENQTDHDVSIDTMKIYANDIGLSGVAYTDVKAGKTSSDSLFMILTPMTVVGLDRIDVLTFTLEISDEDYNSTYSDPISLSLSESVQKPEEFSGKEIWNEDDIRILYLGGVDTPGLTKQNVFAVENNSGRSIKVRSDVVEINGEGVPSSFFADLDAGKRGLDFVYVPDEETVDEQSYDLTISFEVEDRDTCDTLFTTDEITIKIDPKQMRILKAN